MFLTVHAASALVIGKYIDISWLALVLGFMAHMFLDMAPHDPIEMERWKLDPVKKFFVVGTLIDIPLMIIVLSILTYTKQLVWTEPMIWALIGTVLMDFLWGLYYLMPKNLKFIFWPFFRLNHLTHIIFTKNYHISYKIWLPLQITTFILFLVIFLV